MMHPFVCSPSDAFCRSSGTFYVGFASTLSQSAVDETMCRDGRSDVEIMLKGDVCDQPRGIAWKIK